MGRGVNVFVKLVSLARLRTVIAGGASALVFGQASHAASFDCARAKTPIEQAICSDPATSVADGTMGRLYEAAYARLSPAGEVLFRDSQRSFLRYAKDLCRPGAVPLDAAARSWRWHGKPTPGNAAVVAQCLSEVFDKRSKALARAVTHCEWPRVLHHHPLSRAADASGQ
jgi:uncharacterized protein YecT (DUF1311 family)